VKKDNRGLLLFALVALLLVNGNKGGCTVVNPVVTAGPRTVLIVYETADVTPSFNRVLNGLRSGEHAKYLIDHKHVLHEIDDDATKYDGQKSALLTKYGDSVKFKRSLIVIDTASGKVIAIGEITDASTAASVMEFIKQHGG
jgi:hypothetical protein